MTVPVLADVRPEAATAQQHHATTFAVHDGFGRKPKQYKKETEHGTATVFEGVAVFRSGTFADSMGYENTWESIHLQQMVDNWKHLGESGVFANVPVRDGHPGWIINGQAGNGKVVGWHTNLRVEELEAPHDGAKYHYLLADYEILDEDAANNIAKGLWRNRSSEIGAYRTNNQSEHWPVYMGVAYVDIPAVEGLNFSSPKAGPMGPQVYVMFDSKEKNVGDTPPAAPQQGASQPGGTQQHGAPAAPAQPQVFTVNGQPTSDFAVVQAHIASLEAFRTETTKANRENFVTALAAQNKIPAPQLDAYKKHVGDLTPEQYESFRALHGDMEVPALLGQHAAPASNEGGAAPAAQHAAEGTASEIVILKERVGIHKAAGTAPKTIQAMDSYKRLIELDPSFKL